MQAYKVSRAVSRRNCSFLRANRWNFENLWDRARFLETLAKRFLFQYLAIRHLTPRRISNENAERVRGASSKLLFITRKFDLSGGT